MQKDGAHVGVRVREVGERTSGIKPFFRYVTPWPDRERSFRGEASFRGAYFPETMSSPPYTITINFQDGVIPFITAAQARALIKIYVELGRIQACGLGDTIYALNS